MIDIEKYESLPKREPIWKGIIERYGSLYNVSKWEGWRHRVRHEYPWVIASDILHKYVGKSYDIAYSAFCKKLKKYGIDTAENRKYFRGEFSEIRYGYFDNERFIIDDNNLIQYNKDYRRYRYRRYKFPLTISVPTNKEGYYQLNSKYRTPIWYNGRDYRISIEEYNNLSFYYQCQYDYVGEYVTVTFESNNKDFKKFMAEKQKHDRKLNRELKKTKKEKQYSFLTKEEQIKLSEKTLDLIKRDSHGFNEESFKGHPYHGRKRKQINS